jgi:uncharacterized protein YcaQ
MLRLAKQVFDDCVDKSLRLQEERAARTGRGSEYYWYISAAVSLVRKQFKPSQAEVIHRQAIDRVAKLLHKVLSLQDDPDEETLATEVSHLLAAALAPEVDSIRLFLGNLTMLPCPST